MKLYDLTEPLSHVAQRFGGLTPPALHYKCTMPKDGANEQEITMSLHFGTHLDAPFHLGYPMTLDQIPLSQVYGSGVVVDVPKDDWQEITVDDLEKAEPIIREGDIVIINTGWHKYWGKEEERYSYKYPGLGKDAVDWLVKRGVKMIGSDTISPEHIFCMIDKVRLVRPDIFTTSIDTNKFPPFYSHHTLLKNNILLLEQVGGEIDKVTGQRVTICAFPMKLVHGDGSQVRVVAIKEGSC